ncbi:lipid droplet-associated hydrolase isoform X2 [Carica papaya]|uniref:lipid droplet-associated hydrolase isoform X2 n=1 Tax=Carica papaya TaxID=3649 RepID=UPI000B8CABFC|nr:lipid droplet-associated hydrolase isoform X2 [Carica papaya]
MLVRALPSTSRVFTLILSSSSRKRYRSTSMTRETGLRDFNSGTKKSVNFRLCNVSSHTTELLEIQADDPTFHVLFIPGNPGVITFYKEFVESLYELLGGNASVTAIGHISHTKKDWERGKLFSLEEQIDHKMDFVKQELQNREVPIVLVGHSIGSYISLEMLRRSTEKVIYCIGVYPFLAVNQYSRTQSHIRKIAASPILSVIICLLVALLGLLPVWASRLIVSKSVGISWSATAVDATCTHLRQYHTMRNVLFMAMTEFKELSKTPNWTFMRENQHKISFLYGIDDHWGPMYMFNEISKQAPKISLSVEGEGHTHAFCCTEAGSLWVAHHVTSLIEKKISGQT